MFNNEIVMSKGRAVVTVEMTGCPVDEVCDVLNGGVVMNRIKGIDTQLLLL